MILRRPPMKRTRVKKVRSKPRAGRLKGAALEQLRRDCFERDGYRCQGFIHSECGLWFTCRKLVTWESGHMAHIVSRGRGGPDVIDNVVTKCGDCHIGIEHSYGPSGIKPCPRKDDRSLQEGGNNG
jgi:5-methylcytosine-specific restriction endonuclease McrA